MLLRDSFFQSASLPDLRVIYCGGSKLAYILGSAKAVGLMCLHVFTEGDKKMYEELRPYAMKLGTAFQKVNFLRDLKDDYHIPRRTYFPDVNRTRFPD